MAEDYFVTGLQKVSIELKKPLQSEFLGKRKNRNLDTYCIKIAVFLVDLKGIEPSNLTDANRALSQLSYGPISSA